MNAKSALGGWMFQIPQNSRRKGSGAPRRLASPQADQAAARLAATKSQFTSLSRKVLM